MTLTTGWEPDVPITDSLTRRYVFAYADRITAMATRAGGRVQDVDGARMADLASPFGYDNAVVLTRPLAPGEWPDLIGAAHAFFPTGRWWVLLSMWPTPDLTGLGVSPVGHPPLMLRAPAPAPPAPPELTVRRVDDAASLADFEQTLVTGYGLEDVGIPAIADLALTRDLLHLFVGYVEGRPVATAGSAVHHGIVEIDWVATPAPARRRGYGAALTAAAGTVGPDLPALLIASDDGQPVYRRLGYLDLFRTSMWERTA